MKVKQELKLKDHSLYYLFDLSKFSQEIMYNYLIKGKLYEEDISLFLLNKLGPEDIFIDVGAHVGYFSVLASRLCKEVHAVEPDSNNIKSIKKNLKINNIKNVNIHKKVIFKEDKKVTFYTNSDNDGGHALWDPGLHPECPKTRKKKKKNTVKAVTLDSLFLDKIKNCKILKIDTEGNEFNALSGAKQLIEQLNIPYIITEIHDMGLKLLGSNQKELREFLYSRGYKSYLYSGKEKQYNLLKEDEAIKSQYICNLIFSKK